MNQLVNLTLSGLVTGAIYSIMASGLVLTYTTSGIFNFAHGSIAFATAYVYFQLHTSLGIPIVPSVVVAVVLFAPLLGLLLDRIVLRRLARAPVYARVVGTIGLLVMLPALSQWIVATLCIKVLGWSLPGNDSLGQGAPVPGIGPVPAHAYRPLRGIVLNSDQLAVFVAAALSAAFLWFVIRRTRLGLEMRAVVDSETLAGLRGVNSSRTSALAWVMTTILAGLGGVLIAPLFSLTDFVYTLVVLGSLAAVALGGLRSIPVAFTGGLALGVVQNLIAGYSDRVLPQWLARLSGLKAAVPFILVVILLLAFGKDKARRGGSAADDVPRPDHRVGMSALRRRLPWAVGVLALVAYSQQWIGIPQLRADAYGQTVLAQGLAMAIIFLSFVVVTGLGGMVSLSQATFVTVGGFGAGWALAHDWGIDVPGVASHGQINFALACVIGAGLAGLVGVVIALSVTKVGGVSLALGTLSFAFIASLVVFPIDAIRQSQAGWVIRPPTFSAPGLNQLVDLVVPGRQHGIDVGQVPVQILLFLAVFGLVTLSIHRFERSASGRAMLAVRSSEVAAEASGIRVQRTKVMVFGLSAAIAGLGGIMLGVYSLNVSESTAPPLVGLFWLAIAVTFGVRRPGGALIAGLAFTGTTAVLHWVGNTLPGGSVNELLTSVYFLPILSGIGAINLAQEPDGILALVGARSSRRARPKPTVAGAAANGPRREAADGPTSDQAFELRGIVAGYGDVEVLHGVDITLRPKTITALLGANGAGKSTLCAIAAGTILPGRGTVSLGGRDVSALAAFERARAGVLHVPEARGIFPTLSVQENLDLMVRASERHAEAYERFPILRERRRQPAGMLSGGEQQLLSLVPALVDPPAVLIADEPTLGLAPLLSALVMTAILEICQSGSSVLLVEEHAENAMKVADIVAFMDLGRIVWAGPRAQADMDFLSRSYLGLGVVLDRGAPHQVV